MMSHLVTYRVQIPCHLNLLQVIAIEQLAGAGFLAAHMWAIPLCHNALLWAAIARTALVERFVSVRHLLECALLLRASHLAVM